MIYIQVFTGSLTKAFELSVLPIMLIFMLVVTFYVMAPNGNSNNRQKLSRSAHVSGTVLWSSSLLGLGIASGVLLTVGNILLLTNLVIDNLDLLRMAGTAVLLLFLIYIFIQSKSYFLRSRFIKAVFEAVLLVLIGQWILLLNLSAFDHQAFDAVTMPLFFAVDNPSASHSLLTAFIFQSGYVLGILAMAQLLRFVLLKRLYGDTIGNVVFVFSGVMLFTLALISIISMDALNSFFELFSPVHGH